MRVILDHAARVAFLSRGAWSETVSFDGLAAKRAFYTRLRDRPAPKAIAGPFHRYYAADVAALDDALAEIARHQTEEAAHG